MRKLALAMMTGVGFFLHKEWKKRKLLQSAEARNLAAQKQLYNSFKFLLDEGFTLEERRGGQKYWVSFTHMQKKQSLIFNLRNPRTLKSLYISEETKMIDLHEFLNQKGQSVANASEFASFEDYLKVLSYRVKSEVVSLDSP